jgi:glycosyltransferase involved in cell wall biosynthesis
MTAPASRARLHVGVVYIGVPNTGHGGASLTAFSFISSLLQAGHRVTTFPLLADELDLRWEERIAPLLELGSEVRPIAAPPPRRRGASRVRKRAAYARSLLWPGEEALFPSTLQAPHVRSAFDRARVDSGLVYGIDAVAASHRGLGVPVMALMSDPPGLSRRVRMQYDPGAPWSLRPRHVAYRLGQLSYWLHADRRLVAMLRRYPTVGMFAAHHAEWAKARGVAAWYAPSPIVDLGGRDWERRRLAAANPARPRILMIGHLRGIATISGLAVFVESMLPALSDRLGADGFEVRVVGGYDPPERLRSQLQHPAVTLTGHVEPPDDEFLSADLVLVPTPIKTGPRSRIITAMSFGCCVVAHRANALGIPELIHGHNALLADDGPGLVDAVLAGLGDPGLRTRLGRNGRRTYETTFTPEKAGARIVSALEGVAAGESSRA